MRNRYFDSKLRLAFLLLCLLSATLKGDPQQTHVKLIHFTLISIFKLANRMKLIRAS